MLIGERMTKPVITIKPDMPVPEALNLMRIEKVRRFPIIDKSRNLVGIVSINDLLNASPSQATSLSMWEINYLLSKLTVKEVMKENVITVTEDTPLEEAARIMADKKIGCLPVVRNKEVVGIITETDLFKTFLELMGAREPGVRISFLVPNQPGELAKLTQAIYEVGGNIIALVTFSGDSSNNKEIVIKAEGTSIETLSKVIEPYVIKISDVREC